MQREDLQLTLFIIGVIAIAGVLLHGLWKIRKSSSNAKRSRFENRNWEPEFHKSDMDMEDTLFDDVGVGRARVVVNPSQSDNDSPKTEKPVIIDEELVVKNELFDEGGNDGQLNAINTEHRDDAFVGDIESNTHVDDVNTSVQPEVSNTLSYKNSTEELSSQLDETDTLDSGLALNNVDIPSTDDDDFLSKPKATELGSDERPVNVPAVEDEESSAPVYSNVVTQPKPEYSKSQYTKDNTIENISAPPTFLLKKSDNTASRNVDGDSASLAQTAENSSTSASVTPITKAENTESKIAKNASDGSENSQKDTKTEAHVAPDFSLNIQEGPEDKNKLDAQNESPKGVEKELSFAEQAKRFVRRNKKTVADKIRKDPQVGKKAADDQMRIDFDESARAEAQLKAKKDEQAASNDNTSSQPKQPASTETDVLVLNVRASDDNPIQGAALLPMLLTLGFKFGEHDIFHRHVNTNGKGPVLFSLTSMFKPGVFDIDNIENFSTYGLSLFMMLPIEGDAQQVFNMMHNAARKISDEFSCRILDGNKVGLSKQSLQQYVERIREFERRRFTHEE